MHDEETQTYLIAPRSAGDAGHVQELQRCKEALEQKTPDAVSASCGILKARLTPPLAEEIKLKFGDSLIIERDTLLNDPRLKPDFEG